MSSEVEIKRGVPEDSPDGRVFPRSLSLWMAAIYMALFIIRPWEKLFPELQAIPFERLTGLLMIAIVTISGQFTLRLDFPTVAVIGFIGSISASVLGAYNVEYAWNDFYIYLTLLVFFFVLSCVIRSEYDLLFISTCYIVCMAVYLAKSEWEFFLHDAAEFEQGIYRMQGIEDTYGDPNSVGLSIVFSLPILLFLFSVRHEFCATWPRFWRVWFERGLAAYALLAASSVVLTKSRGAVLGVIAAIILASLNLEKFGARMRRVLVVAILCPVVFAFLPADIKDRISTLWDANAGNKSASASVEGRRIGLTAGLTMLQQNPITGVGLGNFKQYRIDNIDGIDLKAHNLVGQLLGETGLLGGAGFLLLVSGIFFSCRRIRRGEIGNGTPNSILSQFSTAARNVLLLLLFSGLFGHTLQRFNWFWIASFCSAAMMIAANRNENEYPNLVDNDHDSLTNGPLHV